MQHFMWIEALVASLRSRLALDERGDVSEKTVTIATMVALALAVGVVITAVVLAKANNISLD